MSLKIRRYAAENSEFTKLGRTRTEIHIPGTVGFTDLTTSKLVLDMNVTITDSNEDQVLMPSSFGDANGTYPHSDMTGAVALLRNSKVVSQDHGLLNERRQINVIDSNMNWYKKSRAQEDAEATFGNSTNSNYGRDPMSGLPDCPFIGYSRPTTNNGAVTDNAVTRRAEIPLPWSSIDNLGKVSNFPNVAVGDIAYRIELEDQIDVVMPAEMPAHATNGCDDGVAVASLLADVTITRTAANHWRAPQVSDRINLSYNDSAGLNTHDTYISAVAIVAGKYKLTLKVGAPTAGATDPCTDMSVSYGASVGDQARNCANTAAPIADFIGNAAQPLLVNGILTANGPSADFRKNPLYVGAPVRVSCYRAPVVTAGAFVTGREYTILVPGDTDFTLIGAANSSIGTVFTASGPGTGTGTATAAKNQAFKSVDTKISKVTLDNVNGQVKVELVNPLNLVGHSGTAEFTKIGFREDLDGTRFNAAWTVNEMYAQLHEIQLMPSQQESARKALANLELPFVNQMLVQRNMPASTSVHTEVVHAPPMVSGMAVLSPQNLQLVSGYDGCTAYRYAINGKETTNRDILVGNANSRARQLHNHQLKRYLGNLNQTLKKYDAPYVDYANGTAAADQRQHAMFPLVLPMSPQEQIVQLQMFGDSMSAKNLFFVFDQMKALKLSNGRVSVV